MAAVHPLASAIEPLLERVGATALPADRWEPGDVLLHWEGEPAVAVRLPGEELTSALDRMIASVESELGGKLDEHTPAGIWHEHGNLARRIAGM